MLVTSITLPLQAASNGRNYMHYMANYMLSKMLMVAYDIVGFFASCRIRYRRFSASCRIRYPMRCFFWFKDRHGLSSPTSHVPRHSMRGPRKQQVPVIYWTSQRCIVASSATWYPRCYCHHWSAHIPCLYCRCLLHHNNDHIQNNMYNCHNMFNMKNQWNNML